MKRVISGRSWLVGLVKRAQEEGEEFKLNIHEALEIFSSYEKGDLSSQFFEAFSPEGADRILFAAWKKATGKLEVWIFRSGGAEAGRGILAWCLGEGGEKHPEAREEAREAIRSHLKENRNQYSIKNFFESDLNLLEIVKEKDPEFLQELGTSMIELVDSFSNSSLGSGMEFLYWLSWEFQDLDWARNLLIPKIVSFTEKVSGDSNTRRLFKSLVLFRHPPSAFSSAFSASDLGSAWEALALAVRSSASASSSVVQDLGNPEDRRQKILDEFLVGICSRGEFDVPFFAGNEIYRKNQFSSSFVMSICRFLEKSFLEGVGGKDCGGKILYEFFEILYRGDLSVAKASEFKALTSGLLKKTPERLEFYLNSSKIKFIKTILPESKVKLVEDPYRYYSPSLNPSEKIFFQLMEIEKKNSGAENDFANQLFIEILSNKMVFDPRESIPNLVKLNPESAIEEFKKVLISIHQSGKRGLSKVVSELINICKTNYYQTPDKKMVKDIFTDINGVLDDVGNRIDFDYQSGSLPPDNKKAWDGFIEDAELVRNLESLSYTKNSFYQKLKATHENKIKDLNDALNQDSDYYKTFLLNFPHEVSVASAFGSGLNAICDALYRKVSNNRNLFFLFYKTKFFKDGFQIPENFKNSPAVLEKVDNLEPLEANGVVKESAQQIYDKLENDDESKKISGVTVKVSGYQTQQREPELANEIRYEISNDNIRPTFPLYVMGKVFMHAGDGVLHTNLGAPGFANSWALASYPDDKIVVEQLQSDYGSVLQQLIYKFTKKNVIKDMEKQTLYDPYGVGFEIQLSEEINKKDLNKSETSDSTSSPFDFADIGFKKVLIRISNRTNQQKEDYLKDLYNKELLKSSKYKIEEPILLPTFDNNVLSITFFFEKEGEKNSPNSLRKKLEKNIDNDKKLPSESNSEKEINVEEKFLELFPGIRSSAQIAQYLKGIVKANNLFSMRLWDTISDPNSIARERGRTLSTGLRGSSIDNGWNDGKKHPKADELIDSVNQMEVINENYPYLNLRNICKMAMNRGDDFFYILKSGGKHIGNKKKAKLLYETVPETLDATEDQIRGMPVWKVPATEGTISKLTSLITIPIDLPGEISLNTYNFSLTPKQNLEAGNIKVKTIKVVSAEDIGRIKQLIVDKLSGYNVTEEINNIVSSFGEKLDSPALNTSLSNLMMELVKSKIMTKDQANSLVQPIRREIAQIAKEANFIERKLVKLSHLLTKFKVKDKSLNSLIRYYF